MKRVLLIGVSLLAMASAARAAETPPFAYTGAVVTWTVPVAAPTTEAPGAVSTLTV